MSISKEHTISKSSISNVTFDIEGPTYDIEVARIQIPDVTVIRALSLSESAESP